MLPIAPPKHTLLRSSLRSLVCGTMGILLAFIAAAPAFAEQTAPANPARITQEINDSVLTKLKGNVHPLARAQNDLGAAPVSLPMNHMQLLLQRSPAQEAALDAYLASLQVKGSPNYHKWLTPQQFGSLYGPSDADIQKLTGWLEGQGFTVNSVANGRTRIDFSGSVAQVQTAFHTSIHLYRAGELSFRANTSDPSIPSAIAVVVSGITRLNDIPLKGQHVQGIPAKYDSQKHRFAPVASRVGAHGEYTADLGGYPYLVTVPADAATIYDTPNQTLNAKFSGTTSYTGTGVTIGIMGQSSIDPTLVQAYRTLFVGDNKAPVITNIDNVGDVPGDDGESYLDNEISGGLAPGATIHFYTESAADGGVVAAAEYAIDTDDTIDILSMSYGSCELDNTTAGNQEINGDWQQAAAQGITVVVSSGDTGSAGCDAAQDAQGNNITDATGPLAVNGLASTPYNIAVGGTDFDVLATGTFSDYVSDSSAGSATTYYRTALGYIPEASWNDSTLNNTTISENQPLTASNNPNVVAEAGIGAGAGGASNCATNTSTDAAIGTCPAGYAKPSWQTGSGVPNDQVRDVPDVAFLAGTGFYGANWAVCDNSTEGFDSNGNSGTATCVADTSGDFYTDAVGGTSAAAPAFAGIMALVVQKTGQRQGQAAPILYSLYASTPSVFHDVTLGNNSVPCTPTATTTASCIENTAGYDYESGFNTNAGYDLATGLGSVDATLLVNNWTSASGSLDVANVTATPSATSIVVSDPLTFTVTVAALASGGATPAGSVTATTPITSTQNYTTAAETLSGGTAMITIPANTLVAGVSGAFTIAYTPATGSTFANASTFSEVTVTAVTPPAGTFSLASTAATVSSPGQSGSSTITVTPGTSPAYTGTVNLSCTLATAPAGASTAYNPACGLSAASVKITSSTAATATATFTTTAPTSGALAYPKTNTRWYTAAGGTALACVLFFGIPARRRGWRSMLSLLVFLVAMAGVGCGGGGGNNNTGTTGTTTGTYTFTVTGTDSVTSTITSTTTVTLTVN